MATTFEQNHHFQEGAFLVKTVVVERILCVVDRCPRSQFPDDYYKRYL